jgi:hypothetical protein
MWQSSMRCHRPSARHGTDVGCRAGVIGHWGVCTGLAHEDLQRLVLGCASQFSTTWDAKWCDCMQVTLEWCSAACDAQVDCKAFSHKRGRAVGVCKLHGPMLGSAYPSQLQSASDIWKRSVFPTWQVRQVLAHLVSASKPSNAASPPPPCRAARAAGLRAFRIEPLCALGVCAGRRCERHAQRCLLAQSRPHGVLACARVCCSPGVDFRAFCDHRLNLANC